jgi:nitrate/nitrite transport system permease protein
MSAAIIASDKVVSMHATSASPPASAANESVRPAAPVVAAAPREPRTPASEILLGIFKVVFPPLAGMALLSRHRLRPRRAGRHSARLHRSGASPS